MLSTKADRFKKSFLIILKNSGCSQAGRKERVEPEPQGSLGTCFPMHNGLAQSIHSWTRKASLQGVRCCICKAYSCGSFSTPAKEANVHVFSKETSDISNFIQNKISWQKYIWSLLFRAQQVNYENKTLQLLCNQAAHVI